MAKILARSKAKAALALTNPSNSTLPVDAETRISALEAVDHWHTNKTALDIIKNYNNWIFSGNGIGVNVETKTANYTLTTLDSVILGDATSGNITITLPDPATCYDSTNKASIVYNISKIDNTANTVTISPYASETIAGDSSFALELQNEVISLITDGTNWWLKD